MKKMISAALAATLWMGSFAFAAYDKGDELPVLDQASFSSVIPTRAPREKDPGVYREQDSLRGVGLDTDTAFKPENIRGPSQISNENDAAQ